MLSVSLPEWLGDDKGLSDGDGISRATVTDFHTGLPKNEDDGKNCRNCARHPLADNESGPMPGECQECTRSGLVGGTKDNWTDNGEEPDLPGDPPDTTRVTLDILSLSPKTGRRPLLKIATATNGTLPLSTLYTTPPTSMLAILSCATSRTPPWLPRDAPCGQTNRKRRTTPMKRMKATWTRRSGLRNPRT